MANLDFDRITRKFDPEGASVHCFSSHFFTTLQEGKPAGVEKWTSKRGINVFQKKFIFIPINETLHWSLCVVVNPGEILNAEEDGPRACILFFDSLKAHRKRRVLTHVKKWLNAEWQRHGREGGTPFDDRDKFPLFDPKSKFHLLVTAVQHCTSVLILTFPILVSLQYPTRTTAGIAVSLSVAMPILSIACAMKSFAKMKIGMSVT